MPGVSLDAVPTADTTGSVEPPGPTKPLDRRRIVLYALAGLVLLSLVRVLTDVNDLTSSGTFGEALRTGLPIGLVGLGGLYAERCGVVNIGLEGMMILGTWFGAWAGWEYGPWWGVLIGVLGGAAGGLLHAIATVTFNVDHIVSGVAVNILAAGVARFLSSLAFTPDTGGGITQSPIVDGSLGRVSIPVLAGGDLFGWKSPDFFGWLERRRWFFVSDIGGILRGSDRQRVVARGRVRAAVPADRVAAVAHSLRAPAAVRRRAPRRGGVPRRRRLPDEVHRRHGQSGAFAGLGGGVPRARVLRRLQGRARPAAGGSSASPQ